MSTSQRVAQGNIGGINTTLGDISQPRVVVTDFNQAMLIKVQDVLNLWQGEWFLNTSAGFPWAQQVLGTKQINAAFVGGLITKALLSIQGVAAVTSSAQFNTSTRAFTYSFSAKLNSGALITGGSGSVAQISGG
jgi:hypothetical protein